EAAKNPELHLIPFPRPAALSRGQRARWSELRRSAGWTLLRNSRPLLFRLIILRAHQPTASSSPRRLDSSPHPAAADAPDADRARSEARPPARGLLVSRRCVPQRRSLVQVAPIDFARSAQLWACPSSFVQTAVAATATPAHPAVEQHQPARALARAF